MHALRGGSQDPLARRYICGRAYDGTREIPCDTMWKKIILCTCTVFDIEVIV